MKNLLLISLSWILLILAINLLTIYSVISLIVLFIASFFILKNIFNRDLTFFDLIKLIIFLLSNFFILVNFEWLSVYLLKTDLSSINVSEFKNNIEILSYYLKTSFLEEFYKLSIVFILLAVFYNWFKKINIKILFNFMLISVLTFSLIENTLYFESYNSNHLGGENITNSLYFPKEKKEQKVSSFEEKFKEYKTEKKLELLSKKINPKEVEKQIKEIKEEEYRQEVWLHKFGLFITRSTMSFTNHLVCSLFVIFWFYFLFISLRDKKSFIVKWSLFILTWFLIHVLFNSLLTFKFDMDWIVVLTFIIIWIISLYNLFELKENLA